MTGADPAAQSAVSARQIGGGGQSLSTVPVPNMAATCPSILEEVIKSNLDGAPALLSFFKLGQCFRCCRPVYGPGSGSVPVCP